ncbi:hypothetical protein ACFXA3_27615 [Streptomyces sp. NPDC059456]|uniref:hypothetical protein n=1 Tax=Streptomyces sp. NPDC059456 TaxID=3346838 RepID=UPI0036B36F78
MDMADLGALAAVLSVPAALVTAWWSKRSAERAADAAIAAGRHQADASLEVAHVQGRADGLTWHRTRIDSAAAEFLRASDALIRTVKQLPGLAHEERHPLLFEHANAVGEAYPALELVAPADLLSSARALRLQCLRLERLAPDRAVLRAALAALEAEWCPGSAEVERCPGNPEWCEDSAHNAAFVAWEFLTDWASKDEEDRWRDRDLLDHCLRESMTMSAAQVEQTVALANRCPAAWPELVGGWVRDPLMERAESAREAFVAAARAAIPDSTAPASPV